MALKHLLLNLDIEREAPIRYGIATQLATAHGAHLSGLYIRNAQPPGAALPGNASVALGEQILQAIEARNAERNQAETEAIERFTDVAREARISFDRHIEEAGTGSEAVAHLVRYARTADLVVMGRMDTDGRDTVHDVLFSSGTPVVVVPPHEQATVGQRVMVAWNGSREAARAVKDALLILERASSVTVLCVNQAERGQNRQPGEDLAGHLRHHGIDAAVDNIARKTRSVGDAIVSRIADAGADMLVMGAWGHSRLREFVLGGVTRRVLEQSPVPVLMSH